MTNQCFRYFDDVLPSDSDGETTGDEIYGTPLFPRGASTDAAHTPIDGVSAGGRGVAPLRFPATGRAGGSRRYGYGFTDSA